MNALVFVFLAAQSTTVERVVVSLGRLSGSCVTTTGADGAISTVFHVMENGRGPHIEATMRFANDGTLTRYVATGHHEMGTKVKETFSRTADRAEWKSEEEAGERDVKGAAFYLPGAATPELLGALVRAAERSGGTIALLPAGTARVQKTAEVRVDVAGQTKKLQGYLITGLDMQPEQTWMEEDGTWFGFVSPWFSVVPRAAQSSIEALIKKQHEIEDARQAALAKQLREPAPRAGLALTHARVLDVEKGKWSEDQTVVIVGEEIKSVAPSKSAKIPDGAVVRDLHGQAILPGLIDMHVHLSDGDGLLHLASGVTTVRDVGNDPDRLDASKARFDSGEAIGPHVFRAGFIEGRNEKAASSVVTAETPEEAKAAVDFYKKRGYESIKIYNSVKPELVPILAKEAHAQGMAVTGHIPVHMLANEAVKAGYDGIEHINMLFLNFFATHETDTRDTTRFTLVGDKAASFDLQSKAVSDFLALLRSHHTVIDPTVNAFEDLLAGRPGHITPGLEATIARLPLQTQRHYLRTGLPTEGKEDLYKASFEKTLALIKRLQDEHITVVAGTDALAGLFLHHELALFVRAGLSPAQALKNATIVAARVLKQEKKIGSIAPGKTADLFIVDGDPLAHITDIGRVVTTFRSGVAHSAPALLAQSGVQPMQ